MNCPYCHTPHPGYPEAKACSDRCWETRVKPLGHRLAVEVLQRRLTLAEAEAQRVAG